VVGGTVELTNPKGEIFEVEITVTTSTRREVFLVDGRFIGDNIHVNRDFLDVFPEELPGMPLLGVWFVAEGPKRRNTFRRSTCK
jgi:hypothetical protein